MMLLAIGDPSVMEPALKIPGGAADSVAADGGAFSVTAQEEVRIDAVAELGSPSTPRWSSDRQILPRTVADGVTDPVHVREWTGRALFLLEQGPSQVRKGCRVSESTDWNDENLDRTSKLSAISPSDPVEDSEPGLSAQDRRAIDNLPPHSALLIVRKGPNLGARFLLDSDTTDRTSVVSGRG